MAEEKINIDDINDRMTPFLDHVVEVAKIYTEYKEKLGEDHEYSKFACSLVKIFNQYQRIYVYIKNPEAYADLLTKTSEQALAVLSIKPYELLEGSFFHKRKELKRQKPIREENLRILNEYISELNAIIDADMGGDKK